VHVDGQGTWASAMKLLSLAENMPYKVSFNNVRLSASILAGTKVPVRVWNLSFDIQAALIVRAAPKTP